MLKIEVKLVSLMSKYLKKDEFIFKTIKHFQNYAVHWAIGIGVICLGFWLFYNPVNKFTKSVPGLDNAGNNASAKIDNVKIGATFKLFKNEPDVEGTRWPRFRGEQFDNVNHENIKLIEKFENGKARILWRDSLGEGHAAPAVYDGKVYLLDYIEAQKSDALRCFSLKTGEELWRRSYKVKIKRNHGMSRTIPAVTDKYILTVGPRGHVMCCKRATGDFIWGIDPEKNYGAEIPFWYTGQCPLIDNDTAVIAVGGKSLLVGIDCATGKQVWQTPNPKQWKMSHSSVLPYTFKKKKMYIYCAIGGVCAVSASGNDKGKILWETTEFAPSVVAPSPVILSEGRIFVTAGYGYGGAVLKLKETNGTIALDKVDKYKPKDGLASEQQTPVIVNGIIYGILPKDAGNFRNQMVGCKISDTKNFIMSSSKDERFGLGPYIYADGKFFILDDDGELTIAKVTATKFTVLDKSKIIDGQDAWGPMVITGGFLLMRDSKLMVCIDIRK